MHALNVFAGANALSTVAQVFFTMGKGAIYAAVFLCTGSVWTTIIIHFLNNLIAGISTPNTTGIVKTAADWTNLVEAVTATALGWYGMRQLKRRGSDAAEIRNRIWSREEFENQSSDTPNV